MSNNRVIFIFFLSILISLLTECLAIIRRKSCLPAFSYLKPSFLLQEKDRDGDRCRLCTEATGPYTVRFRHIGQRNGQSETCTKMGWLGEAAFFLKLLFQQTVQCPLRPLLVKRTATNNKKKHFLKSLFFPQFLFCGYPQGRRRNQLLAYKRTISPCPSRGQFIFWQYI